jgi:hypothetical protein
LLTNRGATSVAEVAELIDWYRARWEIEMLFNVLKNGGKVEQLQLGTMDRIERALALYLIVAYLLNKKLAPVAPSLNEVVRMIARAGGFLARKGDGEPGAKTIWEGLRDVRAFAHTIKALREMGVLSRYV